MVTLPKISLGKKNKRSFFNLTHDVNTTSDFGFCQPTLVREFYKDCKINLRTKEFVRLGAMPCPTFGRIEVKTHTAFVPVSETFLAYDYLQAQKTVQSANRSYIPQCADYVRSHTLLKSLFDLVVDCDNYYYGGQIPYPSVDLQRSFGRMSIWCQWKDFCPSTHSLYSQHDAYDIIDVMNDPVIWTNQELTDNAYKFVVQFISTTPATDAISSDSPFYTFLNTLFSSSDLGKINTLTGQILENYVRPIPQMFMSYVPERKDPTLTLYLQGFGQYFTARGTYGSIITSYIPDYRAGMSFENADFLLGDTTFTYTDKWNTQKTNVKVYVNLHLTRTGRRWYKVVTGCRISFGTKSKKIDLMRLFSYYKAWFDKYNPGRNLQWLDTNCFGLIHSYYDYGFPLDEILRYQRPATTDIPDAVQIRYRKWWYNFLVDLPACCYVLKPDNMTCATATPLLEIENNAGTLNTVGIISGTDNDRYYAGVSEYKNYGDQSEDGLMSAGGLGIQLLNRIYHLVNKNSIIGSKIDEYLKAHNISRGLPQSNVLGDDSFMCNIDDVFATAGTSESALGEYAGKGIGSGSSDNMHFECESFGYLIQLVSVVPIGGYVQGMRDCPINRYDFYQSEFDSLGMEPMTKSNFINRRYELSTFDSSDYVFGFRPRYFGLKIENNLANGGFSLRSQQAQFLPYSLDRIFNIKGSVYSEGPLMNDEDYVADEELRYIGRYEKFGNYDRIFYDTTGYSDNFIVHMIQELSMYAPWKSISDSYDTFDKDVDDTSIDVEKA